MDIKYCRSYAKQIADSLAKTAFPALTVFRTFLPPLVNEMYLKEKETMSKDSNVGLEEVNRDGPGSRGLNHVVVSRGPNPLFFNFLESGYAGYVLLSLVLSKIFSSKRKKGQTKTTHLRETSRNDMPDEKKKLETKSNNCRKS